MKSIFFLLSLGVVSVCGFASTDEADREQQVATDVEKQISALAEKQMAADVEQQSSSKGKKVSLVAIGRYKLPPHGGFFIPYGYKGIIGKKFIKNWRGVSIAGKNIEALLFDNSGKTNVTFSFHKIGYVSPEQLEALDMDLLATTILGRLENVQQELRKNGMPQIEVVRWLEKPQLQKTFNLVVSAIETKLAGSEESTFLCLVLRFGRYGYEMISWFGDLAEYEASEKKWDQFAKIYNFEPGCGYTDFVEGDKIADNDISSWFKEESVEEGSFIDCDVAGKISDHIEHAAREVFDTIRPYLPY